MMALLWSSSLKLAVMEARSFFVVILLVMEIVLSGQWITSAQEKAGTNRKFRKSSPDHTKHYPDTISEPKRRSSLAAAPNNRELRKKPAGHLTALKPDEMDNEGVVSVAVGPPPVRPKFDKTWTKSNQKKGNATSSRSPSTNAVSLVKDVLSQIGRELISHQVSEDFVFGQYVGNSMKNLTTGLKLKMQHEILDLIVKYQTMNLGEVKEHIQKDEESNQKLEPKDFKIEKRNATNNINNETEEPWPDFSNLAKIVG